MRLYIIAILLAALLIPGLATAQDEKASGRTLIARLLAVLAESGSEDLSGDDNVVSNYNVDGNGSVIVIDELVLNFNLNDVKFEHEGNSDGGGFHSRILGMMRGHGLPGEGDPLPDGHPPIGPGKSLFGHVEGFHHFGGGPDGDRHPHPEIIEMFEAIPAQVDPGFVAWIMEIGKMAWTDPAFREHLEQLVQEFSRHP